MTNVDTWSLTNVNMVNDRCRQIDNDKCKVKWSHKVADGSFQGQSMTSVDTWSMTNVKSWSMTNVKLVNDKCT